MEVVLKEDFRSLGYKYDIVDVAPGYARNFLFPKGLAEMATPGIKKHVSKILESLSVKIEKERNKARSIASDLEKKIIDINANSNEDGTLFNKLSAQQVVDALTSQTSYDICKNDIKITSPIKTFGKHVVNVRLFKDVSANVTIEVKQIEKKK